MLIIQDRLTNISREQTFATVCLCVCACMCGYVCGNVSLCSTAHTHTNQALPAATLSQLIHLSLATLMYQNPAHTDIIHFLSLPSIYLLSSVSLSPSLIQYPLIHTDQTAQVNSQVELFLSYPQTTSHRGGENASKTLLALADKLPYFPHRFRNFLFRVILGVKKVS